MWNNCRCNHPCPIFCGRVRCCTNDIVNPILTNNFGFFNNTATQTVGAFGTIAVNFVLGEGSSISQSNLVSGAISLAPGTYEVSYFANASKWLGGHRFGAQRSCNLWLAGQCDWHGWRGFAFEPDDYDFSATDQHFGTYKQHRKLSDNKFGKCVD